MLDHMIDRLLSEGKGLDAMLAQPSGVDPTLLALLQDRMYAERQMMTVRDWLAKNLPEHMEKLRTETEAQLEAIKASKQALVDENLALTEKLAQAETPTAVAEITGRKRPPLREVNNETA